MNRAALGVVDVVYARRGDIVERAKAAAADGYAHIDPLYGTDPDRARIADWVPDRVPEAAGGVVFDTGARAGDGAWERVVRWWRAAPEALLEPWAGSVIDSIDALHALRAEVPGVRLLVDTGHVADWGGDPLEMLEYAGHVQLRQGCPGHTQVHVDDPAGVVDFRAVFDRLDALAYSGRLSVEYFDLPEEGWGLDDPEQWARDLAARLRELLD